MTQPVITIQGSTPLTDPVSWDTIIVSGVKWFGKVDIRGAERSYKWDIKDGLGLQGAIETYRGQTPSPFTIDFFLWTSEHFLAWQSFSLLFLYDGTRPGGVKPVDIFHPALVYLGIYQVICEGVGAPEKISDDLMFRATVKLREYYPPPKVNTTRTPDAAADKPERRGEDPVIARLQRQLAQLTEQANRLGVL